MPRSVKKGPYVDPKLAKHIAEMEQSGSKRVHSHMGTKFYYYT